MGTSEAATRLTLRGPLLAALRTAPVLHMINWLTRRRPRVLLYHQFGPRTTRRQLGVDIFEAHLRVIRDRFVPMTVTALCDAMRAGTAPANAVAITIDDGYENVHRYALPLLRAHGVPATFYVTTGFVERETWLWPDAISYALNHTRSATASWTEGGDDHRLSLETDSARAHAWHRLTDHVATLPSAAVPAFLDQLLSRLEIDLPPHPVGEYAPVSWAQLRELAAAGVEIGDHTWSHPWLTRCTPSEVEFQVRRSKAVLEARLGQPIRSFAYPHGGCSPAITETVRAAGFTSAVGTFFETADGWNDYCILRRPHGGPPPRFLDNVFGVHELASQFGFRT